MLFAMFGVLFPLGASAVYFASLMVLPQHFEGYYSLAVGIATSGVGAGGFAFSALIEFSLKAYGLKSTFRILAGTAILLFVGGMIYGKTPKRFSNVGSNRARPKLFDAKIWKNRAFLIWTITVCLLFMVLYIPFVHLVSKIPVYSLSHLARSPISFSCVAVEPRLKLYSVSLQVQ